MKVTFYRSIVAIDQPYYVSVEKAFERIRSGQVKREVEILRAEKDKARRDSKKAFLPVVCFAGMFEARRISGLKRPSNLMVLDFDDVNIEETKQSLKEFPSCMACWISPSGNGVKAVVKIKDHKKHREHFKALQELFPDIDPSGSDISRACFESYDPDIFVNMDCEVFDKVAKDVYEPYTAPYTTYLHDEGEIYDKLKTWLTNKAEAFVEGSRNIYIYKLASACCRYGLPESSALDFILRDYARADFSQREIRLTVQSSYRSNKMGTAVFDKKGDVIWSHDNTSITVESLSENYEEYKHIIFARDVYEQGLKIYTDGYERLEGINCPVLDYHYKAKKQEMTLVSGYANTGKSTLLLWYLLNRAVLYNEKFALFPPESAPAEEFYLELVEMLTSCDLSARNKNKPSKEIFQYYWEWIDEHFFFVYPEKDTPNIQTIKSSFLEVIIKHGVSGVVIDPFNQLSHNRSKINREDFYLEEVLADLTRFAQQNDIYFWIVAHPNLTTMVRDGDNVKAPDMFSISGGAMWSNKMHNILIYHRPLMKSDPKSPEFSFISSKIKKQKIVGKRGGFIGHYVWERRRFAMPVFNAVSNEYDIHTLYDPLDENMKNSKYINHHTADWANDPDVPKINTSEVLPF